MKDLYRVLKVHPTATLQEIKISYRKLVMELHPDRLKHLKTADREVKTTQFKQVTEAYAVLSDDSQRRDYDMQNGTERFNGARAHSRRNPQPPKDYRKVYRPYAPPNFKTWDHERHYDMHYGDGMQREAIEQATKRAALRGDFEYQSPLGKGFTFAEDHEKHSNPYSKYPQGPPKVVFEYEEGISGDGKETVHRRERVVRDMYGRRDARREKEERNLRQRLRRTNAAFASDPNECVIL